MSAIMNNSKVDKSINDSLHDMSMVKDMNNLSSLNESGFDIEHKGFSKKEEK